MSTNRSQPRSTSIPRRALLAAAPAAAIGLVGATTETASAAGAADTRADVLDWYDTTVAAIASGGASTQVTNNRTWAIAWLAATRAVGSAPRGAGRGAYQRAALAAAVHRALSSLTPTQSEVLDDALDAALGQIADGRAKRRGIAAGRAAAETLLAEREGDGLDPASVSPPFPTPASDPGIWQPTAPNYGPGLQSGTRYAVPFVLSSGDQFRASPPPALGTPEYRADIEEVYHYGAKDSGLRTQEQTDIAQFWYGSSYVLYTPVLRAALEHHHGTLEDQIELVALYHVALVDTQIATSDAKYAYLRWRPITAITGPVDDGDPATVIDPDWRPLHDTPSHPDYPSGHATYSGAVEEVLTTLVGDGPGAAFTIPSPTAPGVTRTYSTWHPLTTENVDARVWSGIHTRSADLVGVELAREVATHVLAHTDRLLR
jgi:hypothetical protein